MDTMAGSSFLKATFCVAVVTMILTIALLIVAVCFYGPLCSKGCSNRFPDGACIVKVTPEREMIINLLAGTDTGTEMVFGSRRMGVTTTTDDIPIKVVSWSPNKSSGFSIKVQVVARATVDGQLVHNDVTSWTLFLVGSRGADGTTQPPNIVDSLRQFTHADAPTELEQPYLTIDVETQDLIVMVKGKNGYVVNFGGDVEILESTNKVPCPRL